MDKKIKITQQGLKELKNALHDGQVYLHTRVYNPRRTGINKLLKIGLLKLDKETEDYDTYKLTSRGEKLIKKYLKDLKQLQHKLL